MSHESYPAPRDNQYLLYGPNDLTLRMHDLDTLLDELEECHHSCDLFYQNDLSVLPRPMTEASITYDPYDSTFEGDESVLRGTFSFDPQQLDDSITSPRESLISALREQLEYAGFDTQQADHQEVTLYALHSTDYISGDLTRFVLGEDDQGFILDVSLVQEHASQAPPTKTQLETYVTHWNLALRSIESLGQPEYNGVYTAPDPADLPPTDAPLYMLTDGRQHMPTEEVFDEAEPRPIKLDDIGGAHIAKQFLRGNTLAIEHPETARLYGIHPASFMLHGPSGTGKSSLVEAFANEIGASLEVISSTSIVDTWVGSSGRNVVKTFNKAKSSSSLQVLFFDEFDSLAGIAASNNERDDVKNILKQEISDIVTSYPHIIVAAATNKLPDDMDPALVRAGRIKPVPVPIPNEVERREIWGNVLYRSIEAVDTYFNGTIKATELLPPSEDKSKDSSHFSPYEQLDLNELTALSDGYTGADINTILYQACLIKFTEATTTGVPRSVTHADIVAVLKSYQKP